MRPGVGPQPGVPGRLDSGDKFDFRVGVSKGNQSLTHAAGGAMNGNT
jgi:hypothetical protein